MNAQPSQSPTGNPTRLQVWILASRPKTLPAAAAPVVLGCALAWRMGGFHLGAALAALLGALLLQIGANFSNDALDFKRGADTEGRSGPLRVTQAGLLSPEAVMRGTWVVFALAALAGLFLIWRGGWPILLVGLLSILSALAYTGGPFPLGYNGLGELFVFIFFGPVAVVGTVYVQTLQVNAAAWWASVPVGLLASAILVVNNYRDLENDRAAGKHTLAVHFGANGARGEYLVLLGISYLIPVLFWLHGWASPVILLPWLTLLAVRSLIAAIFQQHGPALNQTLAGTARLELLFSLLFSLGLLFG